MSENEKIIILFCKKFYPDSTGFANAALGLARSISALDKGHLVVVTDSFSTKEERLELPNVTILRTWESGPIFFRVFGKQKLRKFLSRIKLGWILYWIAEYQKFLLSKDFLRDPRLLAVIFDTNLFPFLGNKVIDMVPEKVVIRLQAASDTEEIAFASRSHHGLLNTFYKGYERRKILRFCRRCRNIVATSEHYIKFFKEVLMSENVYHIWNKTYYGVIPNTVNDDFLKTLPKQRNLELERKFLLPTRYVLMLGRLNEGGWIQKGFEDVLKALGNLISLNQLPRDFKFVVIGDGRCKTKLHALIKKYSLSDFIIHVPRTTREETAYFLQHSAYVILPSRFEGQSMFLTEALSLGVPILTTQNTGASDMVEDGKNGYLFNAGDHQKLSQLILSMEAKTISELSDFAEYSKKVYREKYSNEMVQESIAELLRTLEIYASN